MKTLVLLALALTACGPADLPIGVACSKDADCAAGLSCFGIRIATITDACTENDECTMACASDADCAAQNPELHCAVASCSGAKRCVR